MEGNLKQNSKYTCKVIYDRFENDKNVYYVSTEFGAKAFFLIGMTASSIIDSFKN